MSLAIVYDTVGGSEHLLPAGARWVAGYDTGSGSVPWTAEQFAAHPGAVHIDQSPTTADPTADMFDVEAGAIRLDECAGLYRAAVAARAAKRRPGQRLPGFYASLSTITPLVNALIAGGVTSGPRLWVAHWGISQAAAAADVTEAGPFPIVGYQFENTGPFDVSLFALDWLAPAAPPAPAPAPSWALAAESDLRMASNLIGAVLGAIETNAH